MKRSIVLVMVALAISGAAAFAQQPYDSDVVVPIMRANGAAFGQLRAAQSDGNFLAAAGALAILASGSFELLSYEAPSGSQADWERIHGELVSAALQGIEACAEEDADRLAQAVSTVGRLNGAGHSQFK